MSAAHLYPFHVTATFPEGSYKRNVNAVDPLAAISKVVKKLGLNNVPADPFLITVTPKKKSK